MAFILVNPHVEDAIVSIISAILVFVGILSLTIQSITKKEHDLYLATAGVFLSFFYYWYKLSDNYIYFLGKDLNGNSISH